MITEIVLIFIAIMIALGVGAMIPTILELRRTARQATEFIASTETTLVATLAEMDATLKRVRSITDKVDNITGDINEVSSSITHVAQDIRLISHSLEKTTRRTSRTMTGLRVGLSTALAVIQQNLKAR